jgi:hypothetical protein
MSGAIALTIPGVRLVSEANAHEHHWNRVRRVTAQHATVGLVLRARRPPPVPCEVRVMRLAPASLDTDNLQGSAKHVRDAVAAWLGIDDRDPRVSWHVGQERSKTYGVRILVRPWDPAQIGSRVRTDGETTVTEINLDARTLRSLARSLAALADGGPEVGVTVHGVRVTYRCTTEAT